MYIQHIGRIRKLTEIVQCSEKNGSEKDPLVSSSSINQAPSQEKPGISLTILFPRHLFILFVFVLPSLRRPQRHSVFRLMTNKPPFSLNQSLLLMKHVAPGTTVLSYGLKELRASFHTFLFCLLVYPTIPTAWKKARHWKSGRISIASAVYRAAFPSVLLTMLHRERLLNLSTVTSCHGFFPFDDSESGIQKSFNPQFHCLNRRARLYSKYLLPYLLRCRLPTECQIATLKGTLIK